MKYVDNPTSVINATEEFVRAATIEANRNLGKLTQQVNIIAETMKEHFIIYKESIKFLMLSNQVRNWIEEAESLQATAISMITDISEGRIHPTLIAPNKMLEELEKVKQRLGRQLPMIYKLMKAQAMLKDNVLFIEAKLPIYNNQERDLFQVIPISLRTNGTKLIPKLNS